MEADSIGKIQVYTLKSYDKSLNRRTIAGCYGMGMLMLAPWDVYIPNNPRFYGEPNDYVDLYDFVLDHSQWFDEYEDFSVDGNSIVDAHYDPNTLPVWIENATSDPYTFVRTIPGDSTAPVVIHLIDWSPTPAGFHVKVRKSSFFDGNLYDAYLYEPGTTSGTLLPEDVNDIASYSISPISPWAILILQP